jgi:hypothetical protein
VDAPLDRQQPEAAAPVKVSPPILKPKKEVVKMSKPIVKPCHIPNPVQKKITRVPVMPEPEPIKIQRPPSVYDNHKSFYGIYAELQKEMAKKKTG